MGIKKRPTADAPVAASATGERVVAYESPFTGERLEVDLPLACRFDLAAVRDDLGLPEYIDPSEPSVGRAIALLWAACAAASPLDPEQLRPLGERVPVAVFGGVGFRFLCPSANGDGPFARPLGDLDVLTTRTAAARLLKVFEALESIYGSRLWHAITKADQRFNSMRRGQRFRLHALREQPEAPTGIETYPVDIFADALSFCHTVPAAAAMSDPRRHLYTVGAAEMLLTKLQYIRAVPAKSVPDEYAHRVGGELGRDALIGPEDKDLLDVCALLTDRGVGHDQGQIDPDRVTTLLTEDWGLGRTIALNVANRQAFEHAMGNHLVPDAVQASVLDALSELGAVVDAAAEAAKPPRLRRSRTWWEVVEDN